MVKKQPAKKSKAAGKKAVPKGAVAKNATAPKGKDRKPTKAEINAAQLKADIEYYSRNEPTNVNRRTKSTKKHPRGLPLSSLIYTAKDGKYHSVDNDIVISELEYNRLLVNPFAIPTYTPIHEVKNGKKKIVGFRNSITGRRVTTHYRYKVFGHAFSNMENIEQYRAYEESIRQQRYSKIKRHWNLVDSYKLLHPEMTNKQIVSDPDFQALALELESLHSSAYGITEQNIATMDDLLGITYDEDILERQKTIIKEQLAKNPRYVEVLVALGRRLPSDTQIPGTSDPGHIKNVVVPYYQSLHSGTEFNEGEE